MYVSTGIGLGDDLTYKRMLTLIGFGRNKFSLTDDHRNMLGILANHIKASWLTTKPIRFIRLKGHTDKTGKHEFNVELGNRRARAVKKALEELLNSDSNTSWLIPDLNEIFKRQMFRNRVKILVDESPGELEAIEDPTRDRRVEVFIAHIELRPKDLPPYDWKVPKQPPSSSLEEMKRQVRKKFRDWGFSNGQVDRLFETAENMGSVAVKATLKDMPISDAAKEFANKELKNIYSWKF